MKTDKEIVKEVTSICVLYELGGYTAAEAMRMKRRGRRCRDA